MGILGNWPSFYRGERTLLPVGSVAGHQSVIHSLKIRLIIDSVIVAAQHANGKQEFSLQLKPTLWKRRGELLPKVFGFSVEITDSTYNIARFMHSIFNISLSPIDFDNSEDDKDSDDDDIVGRSTFRGKFRILDNTLRQTVFRFRTLFLRWIDCYWRFAQCKISRTSQYTVH